MPAIGSNRQSLFNRIELFYKVNIKLTLNFNNSINPRVMTKFVKKSELNSSWFEIDAKNAVVGRLSNNCI